MKLQAGDAENTAIWKEMFALSQKQFDTIYGRLGVKFDHALGESFYNPWLGNVVSDLLQRGIAKESEGAVGVFSDGSMPPKEDPFLVNRDGEWVADPALVRKSDGGADRRTLEPEIQEARAGDLDRLAEVVHVELRERVGRELARVQLALLAQGHERVALVVAELGIGARTDADGSEGSAGQNLRDRRAEARFDLQVDHSTARTTETTDGAGWTQTGYVSSSAAASSVTVSVAGAAPS